VYWVNDEDREILKIKKNNNPILLQSYLNLISVIACSKTVHPWFGLLHTIHYFIIFCKIVKTGTAYAESSFLVGLLLRNFKKLGLRLRPWARRSRLQWLWQRTPGSGSSSSSSCCGLCCGCRISCVFFLPSFLDKLTMIVSGEREECYMLTVSPSELKSLNSAHFLVTYLLLNSWIARYSSVGPIHVA